jgi:Leucine-rich repeat (LRR) protein
MNNMKIRNENLALYLGFKLNKIGNEFTTEELGGLTELNLNQLNEFGEQEEVDVEVLDYTPNLETLTLRNFEITDELIEKIKKMPNLKSIAFDRCIISDFSKIGEIDVDYLSITNNRFLTTDFLKGKNYKALILNDSDNIDIANIADMEGLEVLYVTNSHVENPDMIGKLKNIRTLHIENSDIEDISFMGDMENLTTVGLDRDAYVRSEGTVTKLLDRDVRFYDNGFIPIIETPKAK